MRYPSVLWNRHRLSTSIVWSTVPCVVGRQVGIEWRLVSVRVCRLRIWAVGSMHIGVSRGECARVIRILKRESIKLMSGSEYQLT
jgi:hypothetical protein